MHRVFQSAYTWIPHSSCYGQSWRCSSDWATLVIGQAVWSRLRRWTAEQLKTRHCMGKKNKQTFSSGVRPWKYFSLIGWVSPKTYLISSQDNKCRETFWWYIFNSSWKQSEVLNGTFKMLCALWWQGGVTCFYKARFASFGAKIKFKKNHFFCHYYSMYIFSE